jgi:antitoxin VapB
LSIKDAETDQLARETGETITQAVAAALREKLERVKAKRNSARMFRKLEAIRLRAAKLPVLDDRTPDEILGYDENGLPT